MIFFIQRLKRTGDIWRLSHKLAYIYIYLPFFNDLSLILTAVSTTKATSSPQRKQRTGFVTRGRTVTGRDGRFSSSFFGVRDGRVTSLSRVWPNERLKSLHARHLHWMHFSFWGCCLCIVKVVWICTAERCSEQRFTTVFRDLSAAEPVSVQYIHVNFRCVITESCKENCTTLFYENYWMPFTTTINEFTFTVM